MSRHVQHIWALNPDLLRFLPPEKSSFLPYTVYRWEDLPHCPVDFNKTRLKIAHAPTDRGAKGTEFILQALNALAKQYPEQVEIKLIEKVTHEQCLKLLEDVDLVVDQILIGWYGALGVEAMKMGKPTIARIAEEDLKYLPESMANEVQDAVIQAEPKNVYEVLKRCLDDRKFLRQKAEAGRDYVNRWHDPLYVAGLTQKEYAS
ncbi:MAG: glycosyltransferase [Nitrospinales bacterium]